MSLIDNPPVDAGNTGIPSVDAGNTGIPSVDAGTPLITTGTGTDAGTPPINPVTYWLEDTVPSKNDKIPEWFLSNKYKTVEQQAKAYKELEKKLGSFIGAPETYDIGIADYKPDELYNRVANIARELNMSNDGFKKLFNTYMEHAKEQSALANATMKANQITELNKLGVNARTIISGVKTWAENNFTEDELPLIKQLATTADGINLLEKIRTLSNNNLKNNQPQALNTNNIQINIEDDIDTQLAKAVQSERYRTDNAYYDHINELYKQRYG